MITVKINKEPLYFLQRIYFQDTNPSLFIATVEKYINNTNWFVEKMTKNIF